MLRLVNTTLLLATLSMSAGASAAPAITTEPGWSGFVNIGAGVGQAETNLVGGIAHADLGNDRIQNLLDDASSEDFATPVLQFEGAYTLGQSQTQFYLANRASPAISFDLEALAGVRQQVAGVGIVDLALSSTTVPTDVWKDPYLVDANRGDTERTTKGLQLAWRNVMDSALALELSSTEIEIDDEESGASLSLDSDQQRLLRRTGQVYRFNVQYEWRLTEHQLLTPSISYLDYQLDGDAMAEEGVEARLAYSYLRGRWRFAGQAYYRSLEASEDNPVYGKKADRDVLGVAAGAFYEKPFGLRDWTANARLSWYESDNDIDFYNESLGLVSLGMLYRFN